MADKSKEKVLITVSGPDQPGITARLMEIIAAGNSELHDMGQDVTHGLLSLSFVLQLEDRELLKELLFAASESGLRLNHQEPIKSPYSAGSEKFILNCVSSEGLRAAFISDLSNVLAQKKGNITHIDNPVPGQEKFHALEIISSLPAKTDLSVLKMQLLEVSERHRIDISLLKDSIYRRQWRLFVFDMDSTLIKNEVIDELAKLAGVENEVAPITKKAMEGKINFEQSLRERTAKLKGIKENDIQKVYESLILSGGCQELIKTLKHLGYKTAIISGGFSVFAGQLQKRLELDYAFANQLEIKDGEVSGELTGEIITPETKAKLLQDLAHKEGIAIEQTVAVGDGANDLLMLSIAGLGIAYRANETVKKGAGQSMSYGTLNSILRLMGIGR